MSSQLAADHAAFAAQEGRSGLCSSSLRYSGYVELHRAVTLPDMHACHADVRMPAETHQRACQADLDSSLLLQGWAHIRRRGTLRVANLEKMRAASGLACLHSSFRKAGNCSQSTHALTDVLQHSDTPRPQYESMQWDKQGAVRGTFRVSFCSVGNVSLPAAACPLLTAGAAAAALAVAEAAACTARYVTVMPLAIAPCQADCGAPDERSRAAFFLLAFSENRRPQHWVTPVTLPTKTQHVQTSQSCAMSARTFVPGMG